MSMYTVYCRLYQGVFKLVSPLLPWREPELLEGPGALAQVPALLQRIRLQRLLIVTDQGISRLGLMDGLLKALTDNGLAYAIYDRTVPNPTIDNIEEALALYTREHCQGIIAFGGGSPMDCAKGVGARVARPNKPVAAMKGLLKVGRKIPPLVAIPTTAGTGSEATLAAVISNPATHEKYPINDHALIPHYAVLDPLLTTGLPQPITSTTGMDALTHAIEAFIGKSNTRETRADALEAARLIFDNLENVYRNGQDVEGRARLLKAAYLAGKAFTRAYVGYVHAMAHTLGGFYGIPHGLANSVLLPYVLDYFGASAHASLAAMARHCGIASANVSDAEAARLVIERIRAMNRAMNIPEHVSGIDAKDLPAMVARALSEANPLYPVPHILGESDLNCLFRKAGNLGGIQ